MISIRQVLKGTITEKKHIQGLLNSNNLKIYPELEDIEITPSTEEQNFKSSKYGYDNVTVKAVETEELNIIPTTEKQVNEGLFNRVTVEAIENIADDLTEQGTLIISQETTIEDILEVLEDKVFPLAELQEKTVIPTTEEQEIVADESYDALSKVTVAGEENLKAENIKEGTIIFGVEGNAKTTNAKITDSSYLFYNGARIENLNEFLNLCENVTNTEYMFSHCNNLTSLDISNFDTSNVTTMSQMFGYCDNLTSLDVSNFNTSNVTTMVHMFGSCRKLTSLDVSNFDTSNVTDMANMFGSCSKLTSLDISNFDTSNVTTMANMFYYCQELTDLDLSGFVGSNIKNTSGMLTGCNKLSNLMFMNNLGKGYTQKSANYSNYKVNLSNSNNLTHDSLMSVINNLYDLNLTYNVANGGKLYTQQLVLGSTNIAKLSSSELEIVTNKGWVVS